MGEGVVQSRHFEDKGVFQMWTSAFFRAKNSKFFEIYGVPAWTKGERGLSQCRRAPNSMITVKLDIGQLYIRPRLRNNYSDTTRIPVKLFTQAYI